MLHCAYWKHAVRRRIGGAEDGFPRSPSNWPAIPARPTEAAWRADVKLLVAEHAALRRTVLRMSPRMLGQRSAKKQWRHVEQIHGIAAHDLYHTGQIQLTRRLTT